MNRVSGSGVNLRPRGWPFVGWCAAALILLLLAWALWASAPPRLSSASGDAPASGLNATLAFLFVLPALMFTAFAALALRAASARRRLLDELREARARIRCVDELLDVWQWQTDAQHRLVELRPPQGAPNADWAAVHPPVLLWEHFSVDDPAALRARLQSAALLHDIEARHPGAPGESRHGRLRARARSDTMGAFAGYRGTFRELGPTRAAAPQPALASLATTIEPGATESEQESFSYTISHDLRAPIRVVEGFTKIVKEDYGPLLDRVGNDHLDRVLAAAARMSNMIDALLALSKLSSQPLARQTVNLSQLAGYVTDDLRRQWPQRQVNVEIEPGVQVQGDATLLRVVIENLLGNAWKYTGKNAQASIWFERSPQGGDVFSVGDNGAGFDMRFSDRLFGVFQRLHSANDFPGTGIGLASVRRIVRRHGGEIWGEAEVNQGARFHFSLPQG